MKTHVKEALIKAATQAIREVGLTEFKKTSMFLSNEKKGKK